MSNNLQMHPRRAQTRNGKAVGDVPDEGEEILVVTKLGSKFLVAFQDGKAFTFNTFVDWQNVAYWYRLPTIATDDDGNAVGLPF